MKTEMRSTDDTSTSDDEIDRRRRIALDAARDLERGARSPATLRAYRTDWEAFVAWCDSVELNALPAEPDTVSMFIAAESHRRLAVSTIERRVAAIAYYHRTADQSSAHATQKVRDTLAGIRRQRKKDKPDQKVPAVDSIIKSMVDTLDVESAAGLRDRAVLLLGFAGALRRSELVALDVEDLAVRPSLGLTLTIRSSKTDQNGTGQTLAILAVSSRSGKPSRYCPVAAVGVWLRFAEIGSGALFRSLRKGDRVTTDRLSDRGVARIIKQAARAAGHEEADFSGHSLRRGFLTTAGRSRADLFKMMAQSRHKSIDMIRRYVDDGDAFERHAASGMLEED